MSIQKVLGILLIFFLCAIPAGLKDKKMWPFIVGIMLLVLWIVPSVPYALLLGAVTYVAAQAILTIIFIARDMMKG